MYFLTINSIRTYLSFEFVSFDSFSVIIVTDRIPVYQISTSRGGNGTWDLTLINYFDTLYVAYREQIPFRRKFSGFIIIYVTEFNQQ